MRKRNLNWGSNANSDADVLGADVLGDALSDNLGDGFTVDGKVWHHSGVRVDGLPVVFTLRDTHVPGTPEVIRYKMSPGGEMTAVTLTDAQERRLIDAAYERFDAEREQLEANYRAYIRGSSSSGGKGLMGRPAKRVATSVLPRVVDVRLRSIDPVTRKSKPRDVQVETYEGVHGDLGNRVRDGRAVATRAGNIDQSWFDKQNAYIEGLSPTDLLTVGAYSNRSSYWLGPYQREGVVPGAHDLAAILEFRRNPFATPLYPQMVECVREAIVGGSDLQALFKRAVLDARRPEDQATMRYLADATHARAYAKYQKLLEQGAFSEEGLRRALERYVRDLGRIIADAPPVENPLVVYRGTGVDPYEHQKAPKGLARQFLSTTFTAHYALQYAVDEDDGKGYLQRIAVRPGTRALLVACVNHWEPEGEFEIMFGPGTRLTVTKRTVDRVVVGEGGALKGMPVTNVVAS